MTRFALLLRGVNVGGVNLRMSDVSAALGDAGFSDVHTLLASGNVLVDSPGDPGAVRGIAEAALRARFDYQAWVLVYDIERLRRLVDAFPFEPEVPGHHSYVTFVSDTEVFGDLVVPGAVRGDGVLYWQVRKGDTLASTTGKALSNKRYASSTTTRNLRTLHKMLALAGGR
ncbi:DUF1697 domain-containing protein [Mycobacterium sp. M1]|uniref:DUF1697 domain-containing protein n=1 Tax=Mycolicibacter acidiphilus TaxID=2835306 RepID=A0ABS5RMH3_9MYCO|nr:DUF1697 domain-containing protein [Mycolicibacter acidiphilus]MBS9534743.1 DUF1697 domain-containing protein [Mycolicibacter acidiphilus]